MWPQRTRATPVSNSRRRLLPRIAPRNLDVAIVDQLATTELALRDHLEPRPLEVEGLRYTAPAWALIEVVLRPYERTVRIARRDQAETDDLCAKSEGLNRNAGSPDPGRKIPDATPLIPHLAEINSLYRYTEICRISYCNN
jgi:hypothetical protein